MPLRYFTNKKDAKSDVAREAVQWLIDNADLQVNSTGHVTKRAKTAQPKTATKYASEDGKSWGQKVNELLPILGLPSVVYEINPRDPTSAPDLYDGRARFPGTLLNGGEDVIVEGAWNVRGKKSAKDECARLAYEWMENLRKERVTATEARREPLDYKIEM